MGSSSRRKKLLGQSKSFGSSKAKRHQKDSTSSQAPVPVVGLEELVDAFQQMDLTDLWAGCVQETQLIAEQIAEPSQLLMNVDVTNVCNLLNDLPLLVNNGLETNVPKEISYMPGEDEVSTDLTWSGSYMLEHAREILRRERRRQKGNRSQRGRRTLDEIDEMRDDAYGGFVDEPSSALPARTREIRELSIFDSRTKSTAEMSANDEDSEKKGTKNHGNQENFSSRSSRRSIFKSGKGDDTTRSMRRSIFNKKTNGDDSIRSLGRSIFNGVKNVQSKSAEFIQRRRHRRSKQKGGKDVSPTKKVPTSQSAPQAASQ